MFTKALILKFHKYGRSFSISSIDHWLWIEGYHIWIAVVFLPSLLVFHCDEMCLYTCCMWLPSYVSLPQLNIQSGGKHSPSSCRPQQKGETQLISFQNKTEDPRGHWIGQTRYRVTDHLPNPKNLLPFIIFNYSYQWGEISGLVAIIVPFRGRESQLRIFLHNIHPFLIRQNLYYRLHSHTVK